MTIQLSLPSILFPPPCPFRLAPVGYGFLCSHISQSFWIVFTALFFPTAPSCLLGFPWSFLPSFIPSFSAVGLGWDQSLLTFFQCFSLRALYAFQISSFLSLSLPAWTIEAAKLQLGRGCEAAPMREAEFLPTGNQANWAGGTTEWSYLFF